jgi:integrase
MVEGRASPARSPNQQNFYTNIRTISTIEGIAGGSVVLPTAVAVATTDLAVAVTAADTMKTDAVVKSKAITNYADFLKVNDWSSEYASVDLLLRHLSRKCRSEASRRAYLRQVYSLCISTSMTPDELVRLPKRKVEKMVQDFGDKYNDKNYSVRYANNVLHLLKAFFKVNGFKGVKALEIESYYMPSRYRKVPEYIPMKNEIYLMADSACSLRDRALILTEFSSGLRNSTLRASLFGDVENGLSKNISNIMIPVYPEMKLIDSNACKNNIPYFTFICDEATQALKLYLREHEEKYGKIQPNEPLFASDYNQIPHEQRRSKIISSRQLQLVVKQAAQKASIPQWQYVKPHCLRKAFETVLHSELIDGGRLDPKIQEFFMGHILQGSEDPYFDKTKVEMLRAEYAKLNFGRVVVENKFKVLRTAVARAFEGTGIDPDKVMEEYVELQLHGNT